MGKEALVVKREILFKNKHFQGFLSFKDFDFISLINKNYFYAQRGDVLENDTSLQQIIPYVVIINPETKKIFAYRRANNTNYTETRLRNKWSIGIGGHIESTDDKDPIQEGMMRELREEVSMKNYPTPKIIGYVNDDSGVESVHFGIVALTETTEDVSQGDDEMASSSFLSVAEFDALFKDETNQFDKWTEIIWPTIKQYLQ
ncbi:MAG: NUDIX domain-containing protein [archaeon]